VSVISLAESIGTNNGWSIVLGGYRPR
jgi:hypothetical protein